jgi:hypothetical protein
MSSLTRAVILSGRNIVGGDVKAWRDDFDVPVITRAAMTPTSTADAGVLLQTALALIASLVKVSAVARIIAESLQLDFSRESRLGIPSLSLPLAGWVGEGKSIPVLNGNTTTVSIDALYKLAALIVFTGELLRSSSAEAVVRQLLIENSAASLDAAMLSTAAALPGVAPAGVLNGIDPLGPSNKPAMLDAMIEDVGSIAASLAPVAGASTPLLVASPKQFTALVMGAYALPYPLLQSSALADKTIVGIVPAGLAVALVAPRIEMSKDAEVHMASPASEIVDVGGIRASPVRSAFQTDSAVLRFVLPAVWQLRSAQAVAWLNAVTW